MHSSSPKLLTRLSDGPDDLGACKNIVLTGIFSQRGLTGDATNLPGQTTRMGTKFQVGSMWLA